MKTERYESIDGLRAFGCIAIMCWHIYANSNYQLPYILSGKILPACNELVYLFMLISGFGMFAGYYEKFLSKQIDITLFYERRYKKLLPFFTVLLLVNAVVDNSFGSIIEGLTEATMLFGLLPNNELSAIGVAWTLGVIFVFYLLFPYFVFLLSNRRRAWGTLIVSLFLNIVVKYYYLSEQFHTERISAKHTFLYCMPFFVIGGLIYLYRREVQSIICANKLISMIGCIVITILCLIIPDNCGVVDIQMIKILITFPVWLMYAVGGGNSLMHTKSVRTLSSISMEVYLAHMMIFRIVNKVFKTDFFGNTVGIYVINCIIVFVLLTLFITIFRFVEKIVKKQLVKVGNRGK